MSDDAPVVRVRGLPWSASVDEIVAFFPNCRIKYVQTFPSSFRNGISFHIFKILYDLAFLFIQNHPWIPGMLCWGCQNP